MTCLPAPTGDPIITPGSFSPSGSSITSSSWFGYQNLVCLERSWSRTSPSYLVSKTDFTIQHVVYRVNLSSFEGERVWRRTLYSLFRFRVAATARYRSITVRRRRQVLRYFLSGVLRSCLMEVIVLFPRLAQVQVEAGEYLLRACVRAELDALCNCELFPIRYLFNSGCSTVGSRTAEIFLRMCLVT
eukprot:Blabericola_migrator_1__8387@NODE_4369_length_1197_cov_4_071681_g2565_i1_p1_GENE_NODE_4369_length_1197_cov_4_071681_g2565_i1NODE_4369_length_1197_cov_4_071681_g2565_i1_p1_ORF_typecomplete_len187_score0_80_NODE_4369_length_1197_cov_4_071681_g2565_i16221182